MQLLKVTEYFEDLELECQYDEYFYSVGTGITIVILGAIYGLRNTHQIWIWASNDRVKEFLKEKFQIDRIPCYYWLLCLIKMIKPAALNRCFAAWVSSMLPPERSVTIAVDGKTIRSTVHQKNSTSSLHIVSAQLAELDLTYAQKTVAHKSNEIPAVQELLDELDIAGCMIVADALNCQKETAKRVVKDKDDYLLSVKDNQSNLKKTLQSISRAKNFEKKWIRQAALKKSRSN